MSFQIDSIADEQLFRAYTSHRDAVRATMNRVYLRLSEALAAYNTMDAALATTLADPELLTYHDSLMAPIAPYIAQLRANAESMVRTMEAIEASVPGTFGIPAPRPEPVFDPGPGLA